MRARPLLVALALAASAGAAAATSAPGAPLAGGGEIVFVSARATADPGEIYELRAGAARSAVFHSPYAEVALATAPVGRAIAFWSDRSGAWRLMVSRDGSSLRSIAVAGAGALDRPPSPPVFSPDGTRLLVPYLARDAIAPVPAVALARVAAGAAIDLARLCGLPPAWAPDGRAFSCASPDQTETQVFDLAGRLLFKAPGSVALWSASGRLAVGDDEHTALMSAAGATIARIAGRARAWSPDGTRLALTRPTGLVLVRPGRAAAPQVVLRAAGASFRWVAFTPDGRRIAFDAGTAGVRIAGASGGAPRRFTVVAGGTWSRTGTYAVAVPTAPTVHVELGEHPGGRALPGRLPYADGSESILAWTGDGRRLLYDTSYAGRPDLWTTAADGSRQTRLTGTPWPVSEPAWSADGTRLAYSAPGASGGAGIVIADARGRKVALLRSGPAGDPSSDATPSWSPDASEIAVANPQAGGVTAIELASGRRTDVAVDGVAPAWSPDGRTIAFVDLDDGTVWGSAPNGADRHRLLPRAVHGVRSVAWSPDGKRLVFTTDTGIYVAAPDGGDPGRTVVAAAEPSRPSFSPDGREITYAALTDATHPHRAVFVVRLDGSGRRQLTTGPRDSDDPAWRPASRERPGSSPGGTR